MPAPPRQLAIGVLVAFLAGLAGLKAARPGEQGWPERFSALSINMGNIGRLRPGVVDIFVLRWSTRVEKHRLIAAFVAKGPDAFLEGLMDLPQIGYLRTPDDRTYNLHFAWNEPARDGGRRIILATARLLKFWEGATPPSNRYRFTLIEIRLDHAGTGEGKMSITTKVTVNEDLDLIELEEYTNEPARLLFAPGGR